jgi:hypothetical protein
MKIKVSHKGGADKEVFELTPIQEQVIQNDIDTDIFEADMERMSCASNVYVSFTPPASVLAGAMLKLSVTDIKAVFVTTWFATI